MTENVKSYWATRKVLECGYKLKIKQNKDNAMVTILFPDGEIYTRFKIVRDNLDDDVFYSIYDEWNDNITDTFDYTCSMDDCIKSCIYAFITRY